MLHDLLDRKGYAYPMLRDLLDRKGYAYPMLRNLLDQKGYAYLMMCDLLDRRAVPTINDTPAVPERTTVETLLTMSPENKAHYESEKKTIHLLLTRIGDEIYSTVDAFKTAHEM
ncbi:hypothetical protein Tco_0923378 [Tanacetum coccineum]|uniref:Uncharacterized protein n=1 Tax=Tanacetum coccineum TaxID=301880 RepID=A0ABQ5D1R8_9ASTR